MADIGVINNLELFRYLREQDEQKANKIVYLQTALERIKKAHSDARYVSRSQFEHTYNEQRNKILLLKQQKKDAEMKLQDLLSKEQDLQTMRDYLRYSSVF